MWPRLPRNNHFRSPKNKFALSCGSCSRRSTGSESLNTNQFLTVCRDNKFRPEHSKALSPCRLNPRESSLTQCSYHSAQDRMMLFCHVEHSEGQGNLRASSKNQCGAPEPRQLLAKQTQEVSLKNISWNFPKETHALHSCFSQFHDYMKLFLQFLNVFYIIGKCFKRLQLDGRV